MDRLSKAMNAEELNKIYTAGQRNFDRAYLKGENLSEMILVPPYFV
jgi:hypothetical protein